MNILVSDFEHQIGNIFRSLSVAKNKSDFQSFLQYLHFINILAQEQDINCGLELGAGYSTFLYQLLFKGSNKRMYIIDVNPSKLKQVGGNNAHENVSEKFTFIKALTITYDDYERFYHSKHNEYAGLEVSNLAAEIDHFFVPYEKKYALSIVESDYPSYKDAFIDSDGLLTFDLRVISNNGRFERELDFVKRHSEKTGAIDNLLKKEQEFDFIFFDCSEYSSMIEWEKLQPHIRPGGLAIFHDIYFSKSIKNFIPCASIKADPDWRVEYQDKTTGQGLLVAKRIR